MGWVRAKGHVFAITTLAVAALVVLLGWVTGIRLVMHTALLSLAVIALLPLLVIAVVMLLVVVVSLIVAVGGEGGGAELALEGGGAVAAVVDGDGPEAPSFVERYYRFFARRRHPVFWGVPAGALLGALVLWLLIGMTIIPGEGRTVEALVTAKTAIDAHYAEHGAFPTPTADGRLEIGDRTFTDGFGRPLAYGLKGAWRAASWTLTSQGYDGVTSADDLCFHGRTRLVELADTIALGIQAIDELRRGGSSWGTKLSSIQALRCPDPMLSTR